MKTLIATALLVLATQAVAQVDPYAPENYFTEGPYKGQLINNKERRSVKIIDETPDDFVVANFGHQKRWNLARVPKNSVKDVLLQIDYFTSSIPAAHAELRFLLRKPIHLKDQITNEESSEEISDVVFSIEAVKGASTPFGLIQGMQKYFAVAYRLMSTQDKYRTLVCEDKERTTQYLLTLSQEDKNKLFEEGIRVSDKADNKGMYHTWKRNCTTEMVRLLDSVITRNDWMKFKSATKTIGAHYPVFVRSSLKARNVLGEEVSEFAQDSSVGLTPNDCK